MARYMIPTAIAVLLVAFAGTATAQHTHMGTCSECHSMHNSQDGQPLRFDGGATPLALLLRADCVSCHAGLNSPANFAPSPARARRISSTGTLNTTVSSPRITAFSPPTYTWGDSPGINGGVLAGGSFYWVTINDAYGHNDTTIPGVMPDSRFGNTPPGGTTLTSPLQCAGTNGCHGDPSVSSVPLLALNKAHHNNISGTVDGTTVGRSYRFLLGVKGVEDPDWEWTVSGNDHNRYAGEVRMVENRSPSAATISGNCAKCHGDFHNSTAGSPNSGIGGTSGLVSPWLRHPNDYDMSLAGEFSGYKTYDTKIPLARTTGTISAGANASVSANQRVIMCLTCHRAHGSPYHAMLRWNYRAWPGPGGQDGCQVCHTAKSSPTVSVENRTAPLTGGTVQPVAQDATPIKLQPNTRTK